MFLTKKEIDNFLVTKGYAETVVRNMSSYIRMLNKMGIRTKDSVWDQFYNYSSEYRSQLYRALSLTNELSFSKSLKFSKKGR